MALAETLTEWARAQGQDAVELDPDGGIQLLVDDDMIVDIGPSDDATGCIMNGAVGSLPQEQRGAVMEELLSANLMGMGTGGASLSLDILRDEVVLCRVFHTDDLSTAVFDREFGRFVDVLRFWRERHQAGKLGDSVTASGGGDDGNHPGPEGLVRI